MSKYHPILKVLFPSTLILLQVTEARTQTGSSMKQLIGWWRICRVGGRGLRDLTGVLSVCSLSSGPGFSFPASFFSSGSAEATRRLPISGLHPIHWKKYFPQTFHPKAPNWLMIKHTCNELVNETSKCLKWPDLSQVLQKSHVLKVRKRIPPEKAGYAARQRNEDEAS